MSIWTNEVFFTPVTGVWKFENCHYRVKIQNCRRPMVWPIKTCARRPLKPMKKDLYLYWYFSPSMTSLLFLMSTIRINWLSLWYPALSPTFFLARHTWNPILFYCTVLQENQENQIINCVKVLLCENTARKSGKSNCDSSFPRSNTTIESPLISQNKLYS